jgi:PAS domain S-box-containing protein
VEHDRDGAIVSSNKAALAILGLPEASTDGQVSLNIGMSGCHEDGQPFPAECHPAMVALATGRSQRDVIMGVMRPDGQRVWISINSEPIRDDENGQVVSVVTSFSDITEKRQAETELRESRERLRALSTHLQEIREEEKAMIAREVHDELGGTMTALKLGLSWLEGRLGNAEPVIYEKLTSMSRLLEQAVHTVRRLVTQLRPTILDDLGLWAALEWQLREFAQYSQLQVIDNLQDQVVEVSRGKALAIYRVLQEALTNIAKHAGAGKVRLDCWNRDGILHIMLEDDGMGLSETTTLSPTSHGLRGMYERIASVGGRLEILSTPGEGTVITIEVPHD